MNVWYERFRLSSTPDRRILTEEIRRRANIGKNHWAARLQLIPDCMQYKDKIKTYIDNMPEHEVNGLGIVLFGPLGSGKTSIGVIILRNALARGGRALFIRASDAIDVVADTGRPRLLPNGAPITEGMKHVNYLLLDEVKSTEPDWRLRKLENVIRSRYDNSLPTIITTNMTRSEMESIGWLKSLFQDRSKFMGVEVAGINWRRNPPNKTK